MSELDAFLPAILPYAPGCAELAATAALLKAAQTFCERTRLWRYEASLDLVPSTGDLVPVPVGASLFEIESARLDGRSLTPKSLHELNRTRSTWRDEADGQGRWLTQESPGSVRVVPMCSGALSLSLFLRPTDDATSLPDFLLRDYRQCLGDGALAELLMLPAQSFSNPQAAQFYAQRFDNRINELFNRTIQGQQRAPMRARSQFM